MSRLSHFNNKKLIFNTHVKQSQDKFAHILPQENGSSQFIFLQFFLIFTSQPLMNFTQFFLNLNIILYLKFNDLNLTLFPQLSLFFFFI
jgi:hypothetical protein